MFLLQLSIEEMFFSAFKFISSMYCSMKEKLVYAEDKLVCAEKMNVELTVELKRRDKELGALISTIEMLKEQTVKNEQRMELQRHELKQQNTALREMYMTLKFQTTPISFCEAHLLEGVNDGENSRAFWILRKHQPNLILTTRSKIDKIIEIAVESGIVSRNIGRCVQNCPTPHHDCADVFYKALLTKVGELPETLKTFLLLMHERLVPNCQIFDKMLNEL